MSETLEVRPGDVTRSEIEAAWKEIVAHADGDADVRELLLDHGVDPRAFAAAELEVDEADGDGGLTIAIAIASPVAVHVLQSLWDDFVRPRLRARTKRDAGDALDAR